METVLGEPRTRRPAGVIASLLALVGGFTAVCAWGLHATPWPEDFSAPLKLAHLEEQGERYDAVYIGSSNIFRSYVPTVIDAELAREGTPLTTFNLGAKSLLSYETDFVLRKALAIEGFEPDWVLIEPGDWYAEPKDEDPLVNMLSNRSVFWHDPRQTTRVLTSIARSDLSLSRKFELTRHHLHAFARKVTSFGQGWRIIDHLRGIPEEQSFPAEAIAADRGYQSLEALEEIDFDVLKIRRRLLLQDKSGYENKIAKMRLENKQPLPPDAYAREAIAEQMAMVRAAGSRPVYILPPVSLANPTAHRLADEGVIRLLAHDDPLAYPGLYAADAHFDPNHLTEEAAARFSLFFARDFAKFLRAQLAR